MQGKGGGREGHPGVGVGREVLLTEEGEGCGSRGGRVRCGDGGGWPGEGVVEEEARVRAAEEEDGLVGLRVVEEEEGFGLRVEGYGCDRFAEVEGGSISRGGSLWAIDVDFVVPTRRRDKVSSMSVGGLPPWPKDRARDDVFAMIFPLVEIQSVGGDSEQVSGHGRAEQDVFVEGHTGQDGSVREGRIGGVKRE